MSVEHALFLLSLYFIFHVSFSFPAVRLISELPCVKKKPQYRFLVAVFWPLLLVFTIPHVWNSIYLDLYADNSKH